MGITVEFMIRDYAHRLPSHYRPRGASLRSRSAQSYAAPSWTAAAIGLFIGMALTGTMAWKLANKQTTAAPSVTAAAAHQANQSHVAHPKASHHPAAERISAQSLPSPQPAVMKQQEFDQLAEEDQQFEFYTLLPNMSEELPSATVATKEVPVVSKSVALAHFIVQAGSFETAEEADTLKATLALEGIETQVQILHQATQTIYRVYLGPFESEQQAMRAELSLKPQVSTALVLKI